MGEGVHRYIIIQRAELREVDGKLGSAQVPLRCSWTVNLAMRGRVPG